MLYLMLQCVLQHVLQCALQRVLQCVLQCVGMSIDIPNTRTHCTLLQHTATLYNILQHATAHCNSLQHVAISGDMCVRHVCERESLYRDTARG